MAVQFPAQAQSSRARQRLPLRGSCQNRQVLTEGVQPARPFPPRRRFRRKQARQLPFAVTTPSRENAMPERPQTLRHCSIKNNFSDDYGQSATTTTAASGGNREELLGQRPARRECRPRHDADAGCRNPISGGHSKSSRPQRKRLQRFYPVEQILCGFHGVLAAKGHPHAAGQYVRQGGGLCFEQGGVHAA